MWSWMPRHCIRSSLGKLFQWNRQLHGTEHCKKLPSSNKSTCRGMEVLVRGRIVSRCPGEKIFRLLCQHLTVCNHSFWALTVISHACVCVCALAVPVCSSWTIRQRLWILDIYIPLALLTKFSVLLLRCLQNEFSYSIWRHRLFLPFCSVYF